MNIKHEAIMVCNNLINHKKYSWLKCYTHPSGETYFDHNNTPDWKMPSDPSEDIKSVINLLPKIYEISIECDRGHDYLADRYREHGYKWYKKNINMLDYTIKNPPAGWKQPTQAEVALANERWDALIHTCHECTFMMQLLRYNPS